jgi:type I restriction enzyme, S subunit
VDAAFAGLLMISPAFRSYLQSAKSATTSVCAIYQRSLMSAPFAFPPLSQQKQIVQRVRAAIGYINRLASEAKSARKLIDYLNKAILTRAFRGELVPQDPHDVIANVLSERDPGKPAARPSKLGK